jgi:glycosyltransferase involved in cell wall biosynthesis
MIAERWLARRVDAITAVSNQVKRDLVKHEGIPAEQIRTIINGIDLDESKAIVPTHCALREELGIHPQDLVVGVCCRLVEQKGVAYFLEAAGRILKEDKDIVFIVAGDGPLKSSLRDLADRLGITSSVRFLGFRQDVPIILDLLSVYVLPSLFEGTPLGLLEAMSAGKAVVATRVGSNAEVIEDGISGSLVDPRNIEQLAAAIKTLCRDQKKAVAMGQKAADRIKLSFSLDTMIQKYDDLYQELIQQASR